MNNRLTLNYIVFLILSFLIIFGYSSYIAKNTQKTAKKPDKQLNTTEPTNKNNSRQSQSKQYQYKGLFSSSKADFINLETPLYSAKIDKLGGRFTEFKLKNYRETTEPDSKSVNLIDESNLVLSTVKIMDENLPFPIPYSYSGERNIVAGQSDKEISLNYTSSSGIRIHKKLNFKRDSYLIEESISIENLSGKQVNYVINFLSYGNVEQKGGTFIPGNSNSFVLLTDNEFEKIEKIPSETKIISGQINWFGFSDKYFLTSVLPEIGAKNSVSLNSTNEKGILEAKYSYPNENVNPGKSHTRKWNLFIGPKDDKQLSAVGYNLEKAVDYGWLESLSKIALDFLKFLNSIFNNYGISIIAITFIIRLVFLPLTIKSMRSMKEMQNKMQIIKPKIDALKEKYKDDKATQNSELMKLYTSHGVNPLSSLGGCLPLMIQMPVFLALYYVLLYSIDLRHSSFLWVKDLSEPENLFDIPLLGDFSIPFRILPLVMVVSWYLSQKLTPVSAAPTSESMELQMKMMQFMPIIFTVMFWGLPSGLILYWTVSNILSIGQQLYINRSVSVAKGG